MVPVAGNLFFAQLSLTGPRSHAGDRFKLILWSLPVSNLNIMIPGPSLPYRDLPLALIRTGEGGNQLLLRIYYYY